MVKTQKVTGIGDLLTSSPTRASSEKKHPDRLNLILYREKEKTRYENWFGKVGEEEIYCNFLGCRVTDSTSVKRDRLFSLIHMISTGKLVISQPPPVES